MKALNKVENTDSMIAVRHGKLYGYPTEKQWKHIKAKLMSKNALDGVYIEPKCKTNNNSVRIKYKKNGTYIREFKEE